MFFDQKKVAVIGEWLKEKFEEYTVYDAFDARRDSQFYRLDERGELRHRVLVSGEFIADNSIEEITRRLNEWKVGEVVKTAGFRQVTVTNNGVRVGPE